MRLCGLRSLLAFQWLGFLLLVVCGCAVRNGSVGDLTIDAAPPFTESGEVISPDYWWTSFEDQNLNSHIDDALQNNYSLAAALQRVCAARAVARREASDLWPDLNGILAIGSSFGSGEDSARYTLGLDAGYQVDLWGEIGSRVDAQRLRAEATSADYHAVALTLSADIATTWFSLIEARAQVELLNKQIKTNQTGLTSQKDRFSLGLIRIADVLRQQQLLESTHEQVVVAKARVELLEHQLAVLLGEMPQTASYETGTQLPELPPLPITGLPSELLHRRPDVRRDYMAVRAADRDLASAISAQYPRLNLTSSLLNIAENSEALLQDWFVSIGSQLIAPLLDGGQRRAEVDRTSAVKQELFNEYSQTVLFAFREVEDSLVQEKYQLLRIKRLEEQVKLAGRSSDRLREQYLIGDAEYLDFLSAITGQQRLQRQLLSAQLELRLIRVSLYLALAGDFDITGGSLDYFLNTVQPTEQEVSQESPESVTIEQPDPEPINQTENPDSTEANPIEPINDE